MSLWKKKRHHETSSSKSTSFLPNWIPKRVSSQKKSASLKSSKSIEDEISEKKNTSFETSHQSSDSIYSTIGSLDEQQKQTFQSIEYDTYSSIDHQIKINPKVTKSASHDTLVKEPIYATVDKMNKKRNREKFQIESAEIQSLRGDNRILKERLRELSEENRVLNKQLQDLVKEEKLKEDTLHSKLQLNITELEAETRKEVKALLDRVQLLIKEKESLNDQIDVLVTEKKELGEKNESLHKKLQMMISPDIHKKFIVEHEKQMGYAKMKNKKQIEKLEELNKILENSNNSLEHQVEELEHKITKLESTIESLENSNRNLLDARNNYELLAEESKQMEHDMQTLLMSLLKMTENIAMERNVLLNKTSFHDHQQKEIQTTVIDYSLNIGRLQEHIMNLNKDCQQEMSKIMANEERQDGNLRHVYEKQLDILRGKILAQENTITELENDKKKLESQLELIWQAACGTNTKLLDDVNSILHSQGVKKTLHTHNT